MERVGLGYEALKTTSLGPRKKERLVTTAQDTFQKFTRQELLDVSVTEGEHAGSAMRLPALPFAMSGHRFGVPRTSLGPANTRARFYRSSAMTTRRSTRCWLRESSHFPDAIRRKFFVAVGLLRNAFGDSPKCKHSTRG